MNIEIVEAYPTQLGGQNKKRIAYSLHVYIIDFDIDFRGVIAIKYKDSYIIRMPSRTSLDEETQKYVQYPILSFSNREKFKELVNLIKEKTIEYISKKESA